MSQVAVGLGSNLGDRWEALQRGAQGLAGLATGAIRMSSVFETAAIDCPEPLPYLNAVALFDAARPPLALLEALLQIEAQGGRQRPYPNAPRTLDLDLLFVDNLVYRDDQLTLPHPRLHERLFVLAPLLELAPEWSHPLLGETVAQLEQAVRSRSEADAILSQYVWTPALYR